MGLRAKEGSRKKAQLLSGGFPSCNLAKKSILFWIPGPLS